MYSYFHLSFVYLIASFICFVPFCWISLVFVEVGHVSCLRFEANETTVTFFSILWALLIVLRERSFLKLGTGVEEFLEGCQIILPRLIGVSKFWQKLQNI